MLRIYCNECGRAWYVRQSDDWKAERARKCPECGAEISAALWEKEIIPAFCAAMDANRELYKDSTGYNAPLFFVDMIAERILN